MSSEYPEVAPVSSAINEIGLKASSCTHEQKLFIFLLLYFDSTASVVTLRQSHEIYKEVHIKDVGTVPHKRVHPEIEVVALDLKGY